MNEKKSTLICSTFQSHLVWSRCFRLSLGIAIAFAAAWFGLPKDRAGSTIDQILVATRAACGVNQRPLAKAGEAFSFVEQTRCPKAQREESGIEISIVPQHFNYSFLSAACPAPTKTAGMNVVCAINNHIFFCRFSLVFMLTSPALGLL